MKSHPKSKAARQNREVELAFRFSFSANLLKTSIRRASQHIRTAVAWSQGDNCSSGNCLPGKSWREPKNSLTSNYLTENVLCKICFYDSITCITLQNYTMPRSYQIKMVISQIKNNIKKSITLLKRIQFWRQEKLQAPGQWASVTSATLLLSRPPPHTCRKF